MNVTGHSELDNVKSVGIATFSNNAIHANVYSTGISTISGFRFPTSDGSEDQALVTDGNGSLSFKTLSGGGGAATGAATTISAGIQTATQGTNWGFQGGAFGSGAFGSGEKAWQTGKMGAGRSSENNFATCVSNNLFRLNPD